MKARRKDDVDARKSKTEDGGVCINSLSGQRGFIGIEHEIGGKR